MRMEFVEWNKLIPDWTDTQIFCDSGVLCFESFEDYIKHVGAYNA